MKRSKDAVQRSLERELFLDNRYKGKTFKDRKKEGQKRKWHDWRILDED